MTERTHRLHPANRLIMALGHDAALRERLLGDRQSVYTEFGLEPGDIAALEEGTIPALAEVEWLGRRRGESDGHDLQALYLMVFPGVMAAVFLPGLENGDMVFPALVSTLLPAGLSGLVIAGLLAAIMSFQMIRIA